MRRALCSFSFMVAVLLSNSYQAGAQQKDPGYKPFKMAQPAPSASSEEPADLPGNPVLRPFTYEGPESPKFLPFSRTEWPDMKPHTFEWKAPPIVDDKALPINLPSALRLVNSRSLDVAIAVQTVEQARALHDFAKYIWLPTVQIGPQYFRHNGLVQNGFGNVTNTPVTAFNVGAGVTMTFTPSDAIFSALAAKQVVRSTNADLTTTINDTTLAVARAYFTAQQSRGELFGALDTVRQADRLVKLTEKLAAISEGAKETSNGLVLPLEVSRARAEQAVRHQAAESALENWRVNSAELVRILRMDPAALVNPEEAPHLQVSLVSLEQPTEGLIAIGLRNRPELASQQALVEAAILRLKAEKIRPLVPSLVITGDGPGGSSASIFGGGQDSVSSTYGTRADVGVQALWTFQGLGLSNLALIRQRNAEQRAASLSLLRAQDRVASEVVQAFANVRSADRRVKEAESGLKDALDSLNKNFQGLRQTKRVGETLVLIIRPQEVVQALEALAQAYTLYYDNVGDYNRAQFTLFRALGYPTQLVGNDPANLPPMSSGRGIHHQD